MRRLCHFRLLMCVTLGGCAASELVVSLRTDLQPEIAFDEVVVSIDGRNVLTAPVSDYAGDWLRGIQLGTFAHSTAVSQLSGELRLASTPVVARRVAVRANAELSAVTLVLQAACVGIDCSPTPEATCVSGQCASSECAPEQPEACTEVECTSDADCPALGECAPGQCIDRLCYQPPRPNLCADEEQCTPTGSCRNPDLLVHFTFEDGEPGEGIVNAADSGRPGIAIESVAQSTEGRVGAQAFSNDVATGMIVIDNTDGRLTTTTGFTVAAWVRIARDDNLMVWSCKPIGDEIQNTWWLAFSEGRPQYRVRGSAGDEPTQVGPAVAVDTWVHVAATYDGERMTLFLNGVAEGSREVGSLEWDDQPVIFAADRDFGLEHRSEFLGAIDDFRLYNRSLTAEEIAALAQ